MMSSRLPDTPVGRQLTWYFDSHASGGKDITKGEVERHYRDPVKVWGEDAQNQWAWTAARWGAFTFVGVEVLSPFEMTVRISTESETQWRIHCTVEREAPHRIETLDRDRVRDFELVVREATEADAAVLSDIERRSPIVLGDTLMTFDRGDDYFAAARLMEDVMIVLAEVDGVPAGLEWIACHRARIGGVEYGLTIYIHLRIAPEHQRKGIWGALARKLSEKYALGPRIDSDYACGARANEAIQQGFRAKPKWSFGPFRALISVAERAGDPCGRPAKPGDVERIVEILNTSHRDEEMYLPYTVESLRARVERAPDLYSWDRVWIGENALVGVWPSGEKTRVITERNGQRSEALHGLVLDYGLLPGAEGEFESLLRAWCGWLASHGHSHLSILTSEASRGFSVVRALADQMEPFDLWTTYIREPEGAARRGVYIDQVYF